MKKEHLNSRIWPMYWCVLLPSEFIASGANEKSLLLSHDDDMEEGGVGENLFLPQLRCFSHWGREVRFCFILYKYLFTKSLNKHHGIKGRVPHSGSCACSFQLNGFYQGGMHSTFGLVHSTSTQPPCWYELWRVLAIMLTCHICLMCYVCSLQLQGLIANLGKKFWELEPAVWDVYNHVGLR